jgi:hypothetical protein
MICALGGNACSENLQIPAQKRCTALSFVGLPGRALMSKSGAVPADLLKDFSHVQTTLGFRIGVKSVDGRLISCVVQQVQREGGFFIRINSKRSLHSTELPPEA